MTPDVKGKTLDLSRLARDIAMNILKIEDVLQLHQIDEDEWRQVASSVQFRAMLRQMQADWLSAANTKERVRIKAQTGVESILEDLLVDAVDKEIPLAQRVEAAKLLVKLGELGEGGGPEGSGEKVVIQINLAGLAPQTIDATPSRNAEDVVSLPTD